jgi:hypothetical protein
MAMMQKDIMMPFIGLFLFLVIYNCENQRFIHIAPFTCMITRKYAFHHIAKDTNPKCVGEGPGTKQQRVQF